MEIFLHSLIPHDRILLVVENKDAVNMKRKGFLIFFHETNTETVGNRHELQMYWLHFSLSGKVS